MPIKTWMTIALLAALNARAGDSTRVIRHELGFNAVSLLQQLRVFTVTPNQQPYDAFYNLYYRDTWGLRFGAGLLTEETLTQVEGQNLPRTTVFKKQNFRVGVSWNVLLTKRVTCNLFADGFLSENTQSSSNTFTTQVFPDPVVTRTVKSTDETFGGGVQAGFGVMLHLGRHLSLYTELPVSYVSESRLIEDYIAESGEPDVETRSVTSRTGIQIALPVTVYLVARF